MKKIEIKLCGLLRSVAISEVDPKESCVWGVPALADLLLTKQDYIKILPEIKKLGVEDIQDFGWVVTPRIFDGQECLWMMWFDLDSLPY